MPRRQRKYRRPSPQPDPVYHSLQLARFINKVMRQGKKSLSRKIVYRALEKVKAELKDEDPLQVLATAVENVRPQMEVRPRRVGGATYQVPIPVRSRRGESLAMRWIIHFARKKVGPMEENLAQELIAAYRNEGEAVKKKEEIHKLAEANRAFAHFRW